MVLMRWGLIPFFTKQIPDIKGMSTINAKAENVVKSPTWREPFKKRRCLVPASSFYEGDGWPGERRHRLSGRACNGKFLPDRRGFQNVFGLF
jgi:putative SOS response-associated peptidase YedK